MLNPLNSRKFAFHSNIYLQEYEYREKSIKDTTKHCSINTVSFYAINYIYILIKNSKTSSLSSRNFSSFFVYDVLLADILRSFKSQRINKSQNRDTFNVNFKIYNHARRSNENSKYLKTLDKTSNSIFILCNSTCIFFRRITANDRINDPRF